MQSLKDFIAQYNGKQLDFDGVYSFQCVDLAKAWNQALGYGPRYGNGKDWINNAGNDYIRINYTPGAVPQEGDIVSWAGASPANVPYGHVAIASGVGNSSTFQTFDQNWGGPVCKLNNHSYQSVQGWIRPKNYQSGGDSVRNTTQDDVWQFYQTVLGRKDGSWGDAGSQGYVGKPYDQVFFDLYRTPEAVANRDKVFVQIPNQIAELNTKNTDLSNQLAACNSQLEAANTKIAELDTNNKNLADQIAVLNNEVADLRKQLSDGSVTVPSPSQPLIDYSIGVLLAAIWAKITRSIK